MRQTCGGCLMVACWLTRWQIHTTDHAMIDFASAVQTSIEAHPPVVKVPKNSIGPSRPRSSQAFRTLEDAGRNKLKYLMLTFIILYTVITMTIINVYCLLDNLILYTNYGLPTDSKFHTSTSFTPHTAYYTLHRMI